MKIRSIAITLCLVCCSWAPAQNRADIEVEFYGRIQSLPRGGIGPGSWQVAGRRVDVAEATELDSRDAPFTVGGYAQVIGINRPDGSVSASRVRADISCCGDVRFRFRGRLERSTPAAPAGVWRIGGRAVEVDSQTAILIDNAAVCLCGSQDGVEVNIQEKPTAGEPTRLDLGVCVEVAGIVGKSNGVLRASSIETVASDEC